MDMKDTKRLVCAGLIGLSLLAAAASVKADSHEHYLPLEVGNSWTYTNGTEEITFTITGTEEINGHTYYRFDDYFYYVGYDAKGIVTWGKELLIRYEPDFDSILMCLNGYKVIMYNFSGRYPDLIIQYYYLSQTGVTCNVPAGEFNDCYIFEPISIWGGSSGGIFGEYLAPNVGVVKYVQYGDSSTGYKPIIFELKSYRIGVIEAGVDIEPDVINLKSSGKWITSYIWLDEEYDVADIEPDSVRLEGEIEADWVWFDEEEEVMMAKFSRAELQEMLEPGEEVELTVTGELADGTRFKGTDTIKVIDKGRKKE